MTVVERHQVHKALQEADKVPEFEGCIALSVLPFGPVSDQTLQRQASGEAVRRGHRLLSLSLL